MTTGEITATATDGQLLAADDARGSIELQLISGNPVFLAFDGDVAVKDTGRLLTLAAPYDSTYRIVGYRAAMEVRCVCQAGESGVVGYVTT